MAGLFANKAWPIGMDIGTESVRLLQLAPTGDLIQAVACGRWWFPESVGDDPKARRDAMIEPVRKMLKGRRFRGRQVITALSCDQIEIKNVRLPMMPDSQIRQAVEAEAADRFDFPVQGNQLNFLRSGTVRSGNEVRNEVVMLAARDEIIQDHIAMLEEMGLYPDHIEAEPVALFRNQLRYLRRQADEEAVSVVIDIGVRGTCVVVARGREPVFVKFIDIGGRRMTEAVARQLNLNYHDARQMRLRAAKIRSRGGDRRGDDHNDTPDRSSVDWTIRDAIRSEVESLSREIALCLRYCSVTFRGLRPEGVMLMGGQACDPLCVDMIAEQLNMDCSVCQPLRNVESSAADFGEDRRSLMTDWALCTGLALYHADFAQDKRDSHGSQNRLSA